MEQGEEKLTGTKQFAPNITLPKQHLRRIVVEIGPCRYVAVVVVAVVVVVLAAVAIGGYMGSSIRGYGDPLEQQLGRRHVIETLGGVGGVCICAGARVVAGAAAAHLPPGPLEREAIVMKQVEQMIRNGTMNERVRLYTTHLHTLTHTYTHIHLQNLYTSKTHIKQLNN